MKTQSRLIYVIWIQQVLIRAEFSVYLNELKSQASFERVFGCVLVYRYTKEGNINELRHNSMYGYENKRNSLVYRYTRTAPCILIKVTRRQLLWVCVCTRVSPVARRSYFVLFCLSKSAAKTLFDIQHRIISLKSWATCSANIFRTLSRTLFKGDLCRMCLQSPAVRPTLPTCLLSSLSHAAKKQIWRAFRVDKYFALKS